MSILAILESIKNTSSTLGKKAILEQNKDNQTLQKVLKYTLDPSIVSGYKKLPQADDVYQHMTLDEAIDKLECIYKRGVTGNAGRDFIASVLGAVSEDDQEVLRKMLTKNLDCGIQEKNCNDVFGKGFISEVPYQRCSLLTEKTIKNINLKDYDYFYSDVKMDGTYLAHTIKNGVIVTTSRNAKVYDFLGTKDDVLNAIASELAKIDPVYANGIALIGEGVCLGGEDGETVMPRTYNNGIISKAGDGKNTITLLEAQSVAFCLWDAIPLDNYNNGSWNCKLIERREHLVKAISEVNNTFVRMVEFKKFKNFKDAFDYNTELMSRGEEGSIIKSCDSVFKSHTSPTCLKVKLKMEVDLRIVDFIEGSGKRKGTLGALTLQSECGTLKTNCGTGFTDEMLDDIWNNRNSLYDKIVTCICNDIVYDKRTNEPSLFLPVFDCIRDDKDTGDSFERILEIKESSIEVFSTKLLNSIK